MKTDSSQLSVLKLVQPHSIPKLLKTFLKVISLILTHVSKLPSIPPPSPPPTPKNLPQCNHWIIFTVFKFDRNGLMRLTSLKGNLRMISEGSLNWRRTKFSTKWMIDWLIDWIVLLFYFIISISLQIIIIHLFKCLN